MWKQYEKSGTARLTMDVYIIAVYRTPWTDTLAGGYSRLGKT